MRSDEKSKPDEYFNPIMYQPRMVAPSYHPLANDAKRMAKLSCFKLHNRTIQEVRQHVPGFGKKMTQRHGTLATANALAACICANVSYDSNEQSGGILRPANDVWSEQMGDCTEMNILYAALLRYAGVEAEWVVARNPLQFTDKHPFIVGFHSFERFTANGRVYHADAQRGVSTMPLGVRSTSHAVYNVRQAVSFIIGESAERLHRVYHKTKEAIALLQLASRIDPDNYTHATALGEIAHMNRNRDLANNRDRNLANQWYDLARVMAPDCGDIDKLCGDNALFYDDDPGLAKRHYEHALSKDITDGLVVLDMMRRLKDIGARALHKQAERKLLRIAKRDRLDRYVSAALGLRKNEFPGMEALFVAQQILRAYKDYRPLADYVTNAATQNLVQRCRAGTYEKKTTGKLKK